MTASVWDKANAFQRERRSLLCVGLDPDPARIPDVFLNSPKPYLDFCKCAVESSADFASAFKPQFAYFAAAGREAELAELIAFIKKRHPRHAVILDAKRGDIGSTARCYAQEAFERYDADLLTVNPYMGWDSITPYLEYEDRGVFVLCKTSNPGSKDFQDLRTGEGGWPVYRQVAMTAADSPSLGGKTVGLVVGTTQPAALRTLEGDLPRPLPLLLPGIGAQGGDLSLTLEILRPHAGRRPAFINVSRGILYPADGFGNDPAMAMRRQAESYFRMMQDYFDVIPDQTHA